MVTNVYILWFNVHVNIFSSFYRLSTLPANQRCNFTTFTQQEVHVYWTVIFLFLVSNIVNSIIIAMFLLWNFQNRRKLVHVQHFD